MRNKWITWLLIVQDEMQVLAECLLSACQGIAVDLKIDFTMKCIRVHFLHGQPRDQR